MKNMSAEGPEHTVNDTVLSELLSYKLGELIPLKGFFSMNLGKKIPCLRYTS